MRNCLSIVVALIVAGLAQCAVAKPVETSAPLRPGEPVRVDIAYGRLSIVGSETSEVRVSGEVDDDLDRVVLKRDGGAMEVRVRFPLVARLRSLWQDTPLYRVDLLIELPADTRLFVVSRDAEIEIEGIRGPTGVGVVSSAVVVRGEPKRLSVESVSGSLEFDGTTSRLTASTLSGDLFASGVEGTVDLEAGTGSLEVVEARIARATLSTVSGDVTFRGAIEARGLLEIETESGAVVLEYRGPGGADLDLETRHGEILNSASDAEPIRDASGYRTLKTALDGGGGKAQVRTRSGLIRLVRTTEGED